ncbi:hypothetical protein [Enterococcus cecorum]|uniref:hypothetical protein n=1 Tax=Enterococcus cecorum TaxID=44008 RepID=UPI001EF4EC0C|nr:hypothetical protein [Enterococcus cecorum]
MILLFGSLLSPFLVLAEVYAQDSNMSVVNQPTTESTQDVSKTNTISPPTANQSSVTNESRSSTLLDSNANQSNVTTSTAASSTSNSTVTSQNENNNVTSSENATATSKTTDNVTPSDNKTKDSNTTETRVSNASSHPKISLAAPKIQSKVTASGPSTSDISTPLDIDVTKVSFYLDFDPDGKGSSVYTGKLFHIYQRLEFDNDKVIDAVYSMIKIAKKYVKAGSVEIPKLDSVKNVESMDDDEYYIRKVYYNPVAGGGIIAFPIIFKHAMYTTPPGSETPISSTLYLREHKIGYSELKAIAKTHEPSITKYVVNKSSDQPYYDINQDVGMPDNNDPTYSSNHLDELLTCHYLITVINGGLFDDYGVYYHAVGTIKDVLPEGMEFDKDDPEEVIIHEKIGHTPEDLSVHPLIVSPLEEFFYEINLENRTKQTSKPYAFYNILPHKGDTMNDQDRIIDRGSTDGAIFKKIAQSDPDFDVYYSEVQDIQKLTTANWKPLTDSVDASRVKSIKVVLKKEMQANTVKKPLIQMRASHNPANLLSHNSSLLTQEGKTFLLDSNEVKTVVEEEPEPTPTEPEDKPDEPEPMPTEPEDKPDEPGVPNTAERENDDRFFMNSGGGKFDNQKHSTQGTVKQKELTRVAKSNTKKHLPATGMQKNGYLWLSVISLGLAGIVIYFDRRSRWHR